ncbi:hypothetical protein PYW08_001252 [Mythimna loreyi]|uniref:Uncharacterized protein n=1 Tax=Mythimna loreyi TaxID=667449 RepID=A0ACC2R538_9NEOP|nr:hypothetical protein PYW08_001252 [Mythimna loreyi]
MVKPHSPFKVNAKVNTDSPSNQNSSNSSPNPNDDPVDQEVKLDEKEWYYDMSGRKYLFILNQKTFEDTTYFDELPSTRFGTDCDVKRLKDVFSSLNYKVVTVNNPNYIAIFDILKGIASLEHKHTSCICMAILTHGGRGGLLYAADRPYNFRLVEGIFGHLSCLANVPKVFFVQACRGRSLDAGHIGLVPDQRDRNLSTPNSKKSCRSDICFDEVVPIMKAFNNGWTYNAHMRDCSYYNFLKGFAMDSIARNPFDNPSGYVPTYADILVLYSTVENFVSYRFSDGTWMIQALCDNIEEYHKDHDIDFIMTMTKQKVARLITDEATKQMPEVRSTLRKLLKL